MSDWQSYRLEDFIPFTPEIYWRLIERINETFWPLHILTVALGTAALVLALRGNMRTALILLAPAWLSSGIIFHLSYYAELNWAAPWFGRAFIAQAAILLVIAAFIVNRQAGSRTGGLTTRVGTAITALALLAYPLIAIVLGPGPTRAETHGLHPDPTALATIGIVLVALRGGGAWLALVIPMLWCLVATLTLIPLGAAWAWLPLIVAALVACGAVALPVIGANLGICSPSRQQRPEEDESDSR